MMHKIHEFGGKQCACVSRVLCLFLRLCAETAIRSILQSLKMTEKDGGKHANVQGNTCISVVGMFR